MCADLIGAMAEYGHEPEFKNKHELTMFADYRVPQILRHLGILVYGQELAQKVDSETELPYSSPEEVQIRAATVLAVQKIMDQI